VIRARHHRSNITVSERSRHRGRRFAPWPPDHAQLTGRLPGAWQPHAARRRRGNRRCTATGRPTGSATGMPCTVLLCREGGRRAARAIPAHGCEGDSGSAGRGIHVETVGVAPVGQARVDQWIRRALSRPGFLHLSTSRRAPPQGGGEATSGPGRAHYTCLPSRLGLATDWTIPLLWLVVHTSCDGCLNTTSGCPAQRSSGYSCGNAQRSGG
jgi:ribosomal protein S14